VIHFLYAETVDYLCFAGMSSIFLATIAGGFPKYEGKSQ